MDKILLSNEYLTNVRLKFPCIRLSHPIIIVIPTFYLFVQHIYGIYKSILIIERIARINSETRAPE